MRYTALTAALAAAIALAASAPAAHAQKALVYCPVTIDAGGCDRIVSALKTKFDSVDRGFDGSSGTLDLRKIDLQHYGVFVVPSLADDANKQPYALLRSVAPRLHMAINGRVAVYSGAPDQGAANRDSKDAVIQNLARWAANGHTHTAGLVGLVAFLDLSEKTTDRYSWVRSISLVDVSADEELQAFGDITPMTSRGGDMFTAAGKPVRFSNMASYGLHIGAHGAARTEVSASGGGTNRQSVLIQYSNADGASESASAPGTGRVGATGASFSLSGTSGKMSATTSATTSGPTIATDKPDYSPGDTVTFSGTGWVAGDTVTITIHEDPHWTQEDRTVVAVADGSGNFTNHTFVVDQRDFGVTFTATAVANPSGLVAQMTFTDGNSMVSGTVTDAVTHAAIAGATVSCAIAPATNPCNNAVSTTTNVAGSYTLTVQFGNSSTIRLTASASGYASSSLDVAVDNATNSTGKNFALTPSGPTKLAFPNAAVTGTVGQCIGPVTFQTQNAGGTATNVAANTTVNLSSDNGSTGTAAFYDTNTCASTITSVLLNSGTSSGSFFYKATARGTGAHALTVAATGLTSASQTETINKADQAALTVTAPTAGIFGDKLVPAATGGSGTGALTFATVTTPPSTACSIIASGGDAGKLQITSGTGVCAITATKAADNDFNSITSAAQTVTVSKATPVFSALASQTITFGTATQLFTGKLATASGTLIPTGTVTVTLGTGGAPTSQTPTLAADGTFSATFSTAALNASTTPYPLAYSFTTDNNFSAASDNTTTLTVNKANQTITFTALTDKIYGDADFAVSATATSGLAVTFAAGATDKCTVTGTTVHITGAGSCTITAAQIGDGNYNAATAAPTSALARTFTIAPKALTVTANNASKTYGQVATFAATDFTSSGLVGTETIGSVTLTSTGAAATATVAGSPYPIVASAATGGTFNAANYTISYTSGSLTVTAKALAVTASNRNKTYGDAVTFAGTEFTTPAGALINGDVINSVTLASPGAAATATVAGSPYAITASAAVGTGLGNYTISYTAGTLTVTAKALTITAKDASKTYGDVAVLTGTTDFSTSGLVTGESVTSVTLTSTGTAANAAVVGSPYDIVASAAVGTTLANYSIIYVNGKLTVNKKALTVTANSTSKTYGQTLAFAGTEFSSSGLANSETIGSVTLTSLGATATATVAGSPYTITASAATGGTFSTGNYNVAYVAGSLTVSTKALTITASDRAKTYGDAVTFAGTEFSTPAGALVNGDAVSSVTLTSGGAAATATVAGSAYPIVASAAVGSGLGNYSITFTNGSLTVSPRALTITAKSTSKTYGQTATFGASDFTTNGLVNGDAVSAVTLTSGGAAATASVLGGPYSIVPSAATGTGLANYTIGYVNGTLTVTPKALSITANNSSKTYGQAVSFTGSEFTPYGLVNGETVGSVVLTSPGAAATATVAGSPYAISVSGATGGSFTATNYAISYNPGTLTVNTKPLAITASDRAKTYGDAVTFTGTEFSTPAGGLVNGDAITAVSLSSTGAAATATVSGTPYAIVASAAVGSGLGNYSISYVDGKLSVSPKALTITAKDASKTYGDVTTLNGAGDFSANGIVNSDGVTSVTLTSAGTSAAAGVVGSPYAIVASAAVGAGLTNYTISYVNGSLTVKKKALTITANNSSKTYGQTVTFTGTEFTPSGLVNMETVGSVTLSSAGAASTATVSGSPYTITASAATGGTFSAGNYYITYADGSLTVNQKPLTISANDRAKTYGDVVTFAGTEFSTPAGTLINGDAVASVTLTSAGSAATATVTPGSPYAIVASAAAGTGLGNYAISYADGKLTVNTKALTITARNATKTYGQTAALPGTDFTSSGLVNADVVTSVTLTSSGAGPTANVAGNAYPIVPSAATGTGLVNYTISYVNGSLTVIAKALTITANNRSKTYGDALTLGTTDFTPTGLVNNETVGSVILTSAGAAATATAVPGSPYSIVASNATGGTFNLNNYTITYANGSLTVYKRALTIKANDLSKDYGDLLNFSGTEFTTTGLVNGDVVATLSLTSPGASANALASQYDITPAAATGPALANYTITYSTGTLTVNNHAPVLVTVAGPGGPVALGSPVTVTGNFTDHGVVGDHYVISSTWTNGATSLSVPSVDATTYNGNAGTLTITAPMSIPTGVYTVSITVTDRFGLPSNVLTIDQYVVVYDPSGGFVTGGGWINSPSDACHLTTGCNGVTGKANFGFVSKYQKGANVPDGNTEFQFQAGNLNFKSTAYEWLVIGGARAQYKGTGTINGSGNYGFILTAIDGSINGSGGSDRFRIKIWDVSNPTVMLYDNQINTTDDAGLTTPGTLLGGGSISIKAK